MESKTETVPAATSTETPNLEKFVQWMETEGFELHKNLGFKTCPDGVRGVFAVKGEIKKGETLFKVPVRSLLCPTYETTIVGKSGIFTKKFIKRDPWSALILALMAEHSAGPASHWAPFIAVLPQPGSGERESIASPLYWTEAELAELKGTETLDQLGRDEIRSSFDKSALPIIRAHFDIFRGCASSVDDVEGLFAAYMHWGSVVMGRGFNSHPTYDGPVMAPMADMLNHRTGFCNSHLMDPEDEEDDDDDDKENGDDDNIDLDDLEEIKEDKAEEEEVGNEESEKENGSKDEKLPMITLCDVPCGGELINTYGDRSNGELLRRYGFTDEVNPYDCVYIPWQMLGHKDRVKRMVSSEDVSEDGFLLETEGKLPKDMRKAVHVCALDENEYKKAKKRLAVKAPLEAKMTAVEWAIVKDAVEERLSKYPTTLEQDKALLETNRAVMTINMLNALRVRIGEKTILDKVLTKCKEKTKAN